VAESGYVPIATLVRLLEAHGYQPDVPRPVSATEVYLRFTPPIGTRLPVVGVTSERGMVRRQYVERIKGIIQDFEP